MSERMTVFLFLLVASAAAGAQPGQEPDAVPAQTQVQGVERGGQRLILPDPEIPLPEEVSVDTESAAEQERLQFEQDLADLFSRGEYAAVRRGIAERREQVPLWNPPRWLTLELDRAEARAQIAAAKNRPRALIALRTRYPDQFTCREYYHLWSLSDAYVAVDEQNAAADIHHQILATCSDAKVLLTTLDRIADAEGPGAALAGTALVERRKKVRLPANELEPRRYNWRISEAVVLHGQGRLDDAGKFLVAVEPAVIRRRDLGPGRLIAWNYRERGDSVAAVAWFRRVHQWSGAEEDRLHLLQLQWDSGDHAPVIDALRQQPLKDARARLWAAEILRGEAARIFGMRQFAESVTLLDAALSYDKPEPNSIAALRGWACLELKRFSAAHTAFAEAYRYTLDADVASGLLYAAQRGGDWNALLAVADNSGGPLLATEGERTLALQLAEGKLTEAQITVEEGRLLRAEEADGARTSALSRMLRAVPGFPGFTWGSIENDLAGETSASYLLNQGVDLARLPGDITLGTYLEYRAIDNSWRAFRDETEGAVGLELRRSPLRLGVEYVPERWRNGEGTVGSDSKAYLSWYYDWYQYLRRRRGGGANPLNVDAYAGSTYGRITHDLDDDGGTSVLGFIKQGVDWFTFAEDITFHTYAAYRFRFRDWNDLFYDAHGPAVGAELQKGPLAFGVDYTWRKNPRQKTSSETPSVYLNWYYGWDLKPD